MGAAQCGHALARFEEDVRQQHAGQEPLRADLTTLAAYRYTDEPPLDVPILAFAARDDALVPADAVGEWSACTTVEFAVELLEGGHFAVRDAPGAVAAITASLWWTTAPDFEVKRRELRSHPT